MFFLLCLSVLHVIRWGFSCRCSAFFSCHFLFRVCVCERVYTFLFLVIDSLFQHSSTSSAISVTPCLVQVVTFVMPCKIHNYHVFMCACKFALDKFTLNVHNKRDERKKERKEKRNQTDQSQVCAFSHFIWKICKTHCVLYGVTT